MAKVRVSALAKELGTDSKTLIAHLNSIGEYVKTASSTIEAPVVRKATETFPEDLKKAPAKKAAAKPAGPAAPAGALPHRPPLWRLRLLQHRLRQHLLPWPLRWLPSRQLRLLQHREPGSGRARRSGGPRRPRRRPVRP